MREKDYSIEDIRIYIFGIVADPENNRFTPGVFEDDLVEQRIRCYQDVEEFIGKFMERKAKFSEDYYEGPCVGFYHFVTDSKNEGTWPYGASIPMRIILKA